MVFKRRDARRWFVVVGHWFYPRGGWGRAIQYIRHRLHRLPGTPESIARGVFAGAFTVFTPFFGLHFVVAALIARLMRGNILAALLATFIGNPLTYVPIALISIHTGHFLLGTDPGGVGGNVLHAFGGAWHDLRHNLVALFTSDQARWDELIDFYRSVFFPYMVGAVIPGIICGTICYYLSVPVIRAYQQRRIAKMREKMEKMRRQAQEQAE
ncbi:DUF2062 domain-containing protein [Nioella nitratireducens]|uniref:DUF2062 domain-containing protein n=1 Tax=Nioella nitratireducens TaxID=1287720 RepID=UPI0008FD7A7D|nr:DUF2062 domain-containing protein [Nioella nitratireducens]